MTATRPPGASVFLVEDEVMIRMMVADMLEELGFSVAAEAGEINEAIRLAQSAEFDLAILDVNVNGKVISPVAELITARNRPFIFADRLRLLRPARRIPRPPRAAKALPARNPGAHDRQHAQGRDGLRRARASPFPRAGRSYFSVAVSAFENSSSVRSRRSGVTET